MSIVVGQRGIGKSTLIIQHILRTFHDDLTSKALFLQVDHFLLRDLSLYEIAEDFYNIGGELLCLDEIHKYENWSQELKSIHDTFPKLIVVASGSSELQIRKGSHDLSRRAIIYKMHGLSFHEFLELQLRVDLPVFTLQEILERHAEISYNIVNGIEDKGEKVLAMFKDYLQIGYYPYYLDFNDTSLFYITLEQNIHASLESDLISAHPTLTGSSLRKMRSLLSFIAGSVPFIPDLSKLKTILGIGDVRTLKNYLSLLEDAGLIRMISQKVRGMDRLEKPGKIYLNNCNQIYAIVNKGKENYGNIRETFFLKTLSTEYSVLSDKTTDFVVDDQFRFEVGWKNKDFGQIESSRNSYLALDDIESAAGRKIPLWLFGFLY
ncbi:MAG: ATP-binding protein [Proteobacteria bacterium]|nr:ATP-binding protein [Pseudomonadota bacterium]